MSQKQRTNLHEQGDPVADKVAQPHLGAAPPEEGDSPRAAHDAPGLDDSASSDSDELRAELERLRAEADEFREQYLRARAEAENTRRRADADVANARKFAIERFARELLTVKDSLDLAQQTDVAGNESAAVGKILEGLGLTLRQLDGVFEQFAIREIEPQPGDKFDPQLHQAMTMQPSDTIEPNHVLSVIQKGFSLQERLLRPAMVIVARAVEAGSA